MMCLRNVHLITIITCKLQLKDIMPLFVLPYPFLHSMCASDLVVNMSTPIYLLKKTIDVLPAWSSAIFYHFHAHHQKLIKTHYPVGAFIGIFLTPSHSRNVATFSTTFASTFTMRARVDIISDYSGLVSILISIDVAPDLEFSSVMSNSIVHLVLCCSVGNKNMQKVVDSSQS